jgi:hypothetical protein
VRRDDEYIRNLLLKIEASDEPFVVVPPSLDDPAEWTRRYHVLLLCDAGLMAHVKDAAYRMTSQGHDYLEAIRDQGIWADTKRAVAETGGSATLEILKALATGLLKKQIHDRTGIDLSAR